MSELASVQKFKAVLEALCAMGQLFLRGRRAMLQLVGSLSSDCFLWPLDITDRICNVEAALYLKDT